MHFQIITPERVVFSEEVAQVTIPTQAGEITVLPHHIPLVTVLQAGELRYMKAGEEFSLAVSSGFAQVRPDNSVVILADTAEHPAEIDLARAEEAQARAAARMSKPREFDDIEFAALQSKIEKELARLKIGRKFKKLLI